LKRAQEEVADASERLADPAIYADGAAVRELVERHNAALERAARLTQERERLGEEVAAAERDAELTGSGPSR
jgi:hypothetical protein